MGRIRAAWQVLFGRRITPQQMQSEWAEIQTEAAEMFSRFNSLAARLVRAEKNMLKRQNELLDAQEHAINEGASDCVGCEDAPSGDIASRKAALRREIFGRTFAARIGGENVTGN